MFKVKYEYEKNLDGLIGGYVKDLEDEDELELEKTRRFKYDHVVIDLEVCFCVTLPFYLTDEEQETYNYSEKILAGMDMFKKSMSDMIKANKIIRNL